MNILVIGSKGFIGSACYSYFKETGKHGIYGADVVTDYNDANYSQIDISNNDFKDIFKLKKFGLCINCSGAASVPDSLLNPSRDFSLNVLNVSKLLEAIRTHAPECRFINISSAAVYGNPKKLPVSEADVLAPVSPYGIHKMQAEQLCSTYQTFWNISTCSLRIFSAYGKGLKKQLFWDLYQKSIKSDTVKLFGTGIETRDFINIDDIIQAIELVIERAFFKGEAINIANGYQCSIEDVSKIFYEALGWKGTIEFTNKIRQGDPQYWQADISTLMQWGYHPEFDIRRGLEKYAEWLKEIG